MNVLEIRDMPTVIKFTGVSIGNSVGGYHESVLRGYQILNKVKELLELNTPQSVILEMIAVMESRQPSDKNELIVEIETVQEKSERLLANVRAAVASRANESEETP